MPLDSLHPTRRAAVAFAAGACGEVVAGITAARRSAPVQARTATPAGRLREWAGSRIRVHLGENVQAPYTSYHRSASPSVACEVQKKRPRPPPRCPAIWSPGDAARERTRPCWEETRLRRPNVGHPAHLALTLRPVGNNAAGVALCSLRGARQAADQCLLHRHTRQVKRQAPLAQSAERLHGKEKVYGS